ncbi:hypothetical protein HanRHA438_Chr07g0320291 [Helianthus annuus]|nr:hypothetical protein HanRHA438_Chr07g0320291 [Helianthus annuus]
MLKHITNTNRVITSMSAILRPFVFRQVLASVTPISTVTATSSSNRNHYTLPPSII